MTQIKLPVQMQRYSVVVSSNVGICVRFLQDEFVVLFFFFFCHRLFRLAGLLFLIPVGQVCYSLFVQVGQICLPVQV